MLGKPNFKSISQKLRPKHLQADFKLWHNYKLISPNIDLELGVEKLQQEDKYTRDNNGRETNELSLR